MGIKEKLGTLWGCTVYHIRYLYKPGFYEITDGNGVVIARDTHPSGFFAAIIRALGREV